MAVVERAEREVVVEFGVPLVLVSINGGTMWKTYGASVGVSGLEGGSGISIKVGVAMLLLLSGCWCILWTLMLTTKIFVGRDNGRTLHDYTVY
jgi:hypothetical protein